MMPDMVICPWSRGFRGSDGDMGTFTFDLETSEAENNMYTIVKIKIILLI